MPMKKAMAIAGIGTISDRIGTIAAHIAEIEGNNPFHRSTSAQHSPAKTAGPGSSAAAFQSHLAAQTLQAYGQGFGTQGASSGATGMTSSGLVSSPLGSSAFGTGSAHQLAQPAVQALSAILQAGAMSSVGTGAGAQTPGGASAQALVGGMAQVGVAPGIPGGVLTNGGQPTIGVGADDPAQGIAALARGTHPAVPDRRDGKVPAALREFGNGKIPADQLESVGVGDHELWSPAAKAFKMMRAAAKRDGVDIGVNSSYRDVACQQCMVEKYGLYSKGGRAAAPGKSNHGWGLSIDLQLNDAAKAWMRKNAKHYGFVEDVPREPWHWTFVADPQSVEQNTTALMHTASRSPV
ncbi:M15 family metallopeptidase [Stomatohabitans albus]|uniref:M15 family metallopeptidase n=1 Tax=Stomatohabitans albus TaxID=3110766 RepID=UPI00300CD102